MAEGCGGPGSGWSARPLSLTMSVAISRPIWKGAVSIFHFYRSAPTTAHAMCGAGRVVAGSRREPVGVTSAAAPWPRAVAAAAGPGRRLLVRPAWTRFRRWRTRGAPSGRVGGRTEVGRKKPPRRWSGRRRDQRKGLADGSKAACFAPRSKERQTEKALGPRSGQVGRPELERR